MTDQPPDSHATSSGGRHAARDRVRIAGPTAVTNGFHPDDLARVMVQFGVSEEQVRRDHAISLILAALSRSHRKELLFFGGTALSRTYLDAQRLSEDIDLITDGNRDEVAARLARTIERALQRSHGRLAWQPGFTSSDVEPAVARLPGGIAIRIQLLRSRGYEDWPTAEHRIEQRYADAAPATLRTPTLASFAGWKTSAWVDRNAPRDLYDLWAIGQVGALDAEAASLFAKHGPTGGPPRSWMFTKAPAEANWQSQLAGQTRLTITAREALAEVHAHWTRTLGEDW